MTLETLFQIDHKTWPLAVMAFMRVMSVLVWLPVFGDAVVPARVRITFALLYTFCMWPLIASTIHFENTSMAWSPITMAVASVREVFFGFAVGFSARMVLFGTSLASHLVGINMGFQAASMFSPAMNEQESAFSNFKLWIALLLILVLNIHHVFIQGLTHSFASVPLGAGGNAEAVAKMAITVVETSFLLGLKLAAPLLVVQILMTFALGLLNRAIPQLNALLLNFPLSFAISMLIIFFSTATFVKTLGAAGMAGESSVYHSMRKAFEPAANKEAH